MRYMFAAAAAALFAGAPAAGAMRTVSTTINLVLTDHFFFGATDFAPVPVASGDEIDLTINLTHPFNQRNRPIGNFIVLLADFSQPPRTTLRNPGTATFELLNPTGNVIPSGGTNPDGLYPTIGTKFLEIVNPGIETRGTFNGVRMRYQVTGGSPSLLTRVVINARITSVPEPTTWAMMLLGFGAAGVVARKRVRLAVAA